VSKFDTRALYACKTMSKTLIAEKKRERLILNERDILAKVHHPCIVRAVQCARGDSGTSVRVSGCNGVVDVIVQVNLSYAFQDDQTLYLVLSLMSGGELGVRADCLLAPAASDHSRSYLHSLRAADYAWFSFISIGSAYSRSAWFASTAQVFRCIADCSCVSPKIPMLLCPL